MKVIQVFSLWAMVAASAVGNPVDQTDGHFSSWKEVPGLIESITANNAKEPLERLHRLTRIKLGYPQSSEGLSDKDHQLYMLQTKERWKRWWETTGSAVAREKEQGAKPNPKAFEMAWGFFGMKEKNPETIPPVWIPNTWTLVVTFTNGDYDGRENEVWLMDRRAENASLTKLRGAYDRDGRSDRGGWGVSLMQYDGVSPEAADQYLRSLCYLHLFAPVAGTDVPGDELKPLYYPHATLRLRDGGNGILWNTEGYRFQKTRPEYGDGEAGRSYYFLRSTFSDPEKWKKLESPMDGDLAPYRSLLSQAKPYFFKHGSDIVELFGQYGGDAERTAMLNWAEKQKAATNPKLDWSMRCDDFSTELKVNVINFTASELEETRAEIKKVEGRLNKPDTRHGTK